MLPDDVREQVREQFLSQLETGNIIDIPPALAELGIDSYAMSLPARRGVLGLPQRQAGKDSRLSMYLRDVASQARRSMWCYRVGQENEACREWYGFFVTLTVDPARADAREIMESGDEWRRYRVRVAEVARRACGEAQQHRGGPPREAYFRYVAVVEHGKSRTHHHLHALLWLRDIPHEWKRDPNASRVRKNATDVPGLKALWPWGSVTKASPFRFVGDVWTLRHQWVIPVVKGRPLQLAPAAAAGGYLMKYLGKETKEWNHRVKASRGLGLRSLRALLRRQSRKWLMAAATRPWDPTSQRLRESSSVNVGVLRREARLMLWSRIWDSPSRHRRIHRWMTRTRFDVFSRMRASVADGERPWAMDSLQQSDWLTACAYHPAQSVSSDRLEEVWSVLAEGYPRLRQLRVRAHAGI